MKTTRIFILRNSLFVLATLFFLSNYSAKAQSTSGTSAGAQSTNTQAATVWAKPVVRITQAIDETNLVRMGTRVHSLARAEFDRGVVADSQPMNRMLLQLQRSPEQEAALRELLNEQQSKNSPNYHAWLTPTTFGQQFGVADADVQTITNWLSQSGFTGIKVSPGKMVIEFSGTAGLVRNAFHTEIHQFMVNGEMHMANVSVPEMPAALAPAVSGIVSLHNFRLKPLYRLARPKNGLFVQPGTTANPCTPFAPDGPPVCYGMGPGDFKTIYNVPSTLDGTGQTIAVVERSNINVADVNQYGQAFGIANLTNFSYANNVVLESSDPGIADASAGDDLEATLDVEVAGGIAPKATILMVVADGTLTTDFSDGTDLAALAIIQFNLAPIMSESFGGAEFDVFTPFYQGLWEQGAAQGISIELSTGDSGSASIDGDNGNLEAFNGLAVSGLASTPFNVAVGGTDFNDGSNPTTYWNATNGTGVASAKSYIPEMTWNDSCAASATTGSLGTCASVTPDPTGLDLAGGGGGQSGPCGTQDEDGDCTGPVPKPAWQVGTPADGTRDLPDVSLFAADGSQSGNFWIMCYTGPTATTQNGQACNLTNQTVNGVPPYNFTAVGGTSAAAPAFAAIMALVEQKTGSIQGNPNYVLYALAQKAGASCNASLPGTITNTSCIFYDVTTGNNSVECAGGSPNCSSTSASTNGVLVEPSTAPFSSNNPGWMTTAGYDLATGLGSVNVANLTSNWGSITGAFSGDTTTITAPAAGSVSITHGGTVNFTIKVAQNSGSTVPTGDVSLIAEPPGFPQFSVGGATLSNGTVTISTNQLPGDDTTGAGTPYPVVAHYAGNGTFAPSNSAPFNVTVNRENSSVQTTMYIENPITGDLSTAATAIYGSPYLFRTDILGTANSDNQICATANIPCPTGTITVTDGASGPALNDFTSTATNGSTNKATLNALGLVEDRLLGTNGITTGSHNYSASYSGDNSYNPSQGSFPFSITSASTQTSVTANGVSTLTVNAGTAVSLVATVAGVYTFNGNTFASDGAGPTGSVTFSTCGSASSCTVTVVPVSFNNSGAAADAYATATLNTTFTASGTQTISATFTTGDTNYTGSSSSGTSNATVTVTGGSSGGGGSFTVSSTPLTLSSETGASAGSTITVTPSGGFTGTVTVTATASSLPPGVTCPNSPLPISVTGSSAVTGTLNCQVLETSSSQSAFYAPNGNQQVLDAKAIPAAATNSNKPTSETPAKGWWALSAGTGFAALFLIFLPGGRKRLHAALGLGLVCLLSFTLGCGGMSGGGKSLVPTTTTVMLTNGTAGRVASGTAFTFTATVTATGATPTGNVQLFDNNVAIGTAVAVSGGTASLTAPTSLAVGTHQISAHYLGDSATDPSQSGTLDLTVTGSTTIAITTSPAATPAASAITATVQ
jgi:Pro-kumamolisin, activation domain/Bacterial Ig-like domain (group 3)